MTTMMPDYEVRAFLDEVAPGKSNTEIAALLGLNRNTVSRWQNIGMPVATARALLAFRIVELAEERRIHEEKAAEKLQESDKLSGMMKEYGL